MRAPWLAPAITGVAALFAAGTALAASGGGGPSEAVFVGQLVVLILLGRLLGEGMQRVGQPAVMGPLIAGILLGPSVFGALWPDGQHALFPADPGQKSMLDAVSQLGVLLLLLLAGMETDLSLIRRVGRAAFSVSITGIVVPFACGFTLGQFLPDAMLPSADQRLVTSLFLGTALSISSVKIVAMVVREMGFVRRNVGQVILASAIIDDTIGWLIIAITFSIASQQSFDWSSLAKSAGGTLVFLAVSLTVGRRMVATLIRWTNDHFVSDAPVLSLVVVLMGLMALITHAIGVHTVLGAFVTGILVGTSPILTRRIDEPFRNVTTALFMPVFFGAAGLSADLTILAQPPLLLLTVGLVLIASVGKFAGAFTGGWIGGMKGREALALAAGMNARGSTEVIVASIGLAMGALTQDLFTMIVTMAILTTLVMPPTLRAALRRLPLGRDEKARLEREAFEAKGFVPRIERILVAADESPPGRLGARLAGMLAGLRGLPVTVVEFGKGAVPAAPDGMGSQDVVADAAHRAQEQVAKPDDAPEAVEVLARDQAAPAEETIAEEAGKGYDLLMIGLDESGTHPGTFPDAVSRTAGRFDGALAVVAARGDHREAPLEARLNILAAVTGTELSRRSAEVALALGRAANAPVTILYVGTTLVRTVNNSHAAARRDEETALAELAGIAARYGRSVRTLARTDGAAEETILREARRAGCNLIIMGVSRQAGDVLSFGAVAANLLERSDRSLVFVAS